MAAAQQSDTKSADSYVGSLISLISKSEIRYEGLLSNINTDEATIGLKNVKSFGTEGRNNKGPQVPPNDKIYEYLIFRGSDIKDLEVKVTPPIQTMPPMLDDPAIIEFHCSETTIPPSTSSSVAGSGISQLGLPNLYQPTGSSFPLPPTNVCGITMPMYWPGFYGVPTGLQAQQQLMQNPAMNASLSIGPSSLPAPQLLSPPPFTLNPHSPLLPEKFPAVSSSSLVTLTPSSEASISVLPPASSTRLPLASPVKTVLNGELTSSLVTPSQFLNAGPSKDKASVSLSSQTAQKNVEVTQILPSEPPIPKLVRSRTPLLSLPSPPVRKLTGASDDRQNNRGCERGRENGPLHRVTRFKEDFDFETMNKKFIKDEVWSHLGKSIEAQDDGKGLQDAKEAEPSESEGKPVYVKDDFFDSLSCKSLDRGLHNGRIRFSERMKLDAETFGDLARHRDGRGGRGPMRGGRRSRRGGYSFGAHNPRSNG